MNSTPASKNLSTLNGDQLASLIREQLSGLNEARDIFISTGRFALERACALGELFTAAAERFPGNYEEWVECTFAGEITVKTAWRYRKCWARRQQLLEDEPKLSTLKDAYVDLELMPPPEPDSKPDLPTARPPYTLKLVVDTSKPLRDWPRSDLSDFILQTNRIAELRAEALQIIES